MQPHRLHLIPLDGLFAIAKLPPDAPIPAWATSGPLFSITRTAEELSIVCLEAFVPPGVQVERGWRCLRVAGRMEFSVVGVLASLVVPLADAGISVFAVSTFETDYLLVKDVAWDRAREVLAGAGQAQAEEAGRHGLAWGARLALLFSEVPTPAGAGEPSATAARSGAAASWARTPTSTGCSVTSSTRSRR